MKHAQNNRLVAVSSISRQFLITALLFFGIFGATLAHASGSKMPEVTDGTEVTDGNGGTIAISENHAHLDPENIVPKALLAKALKYYDANQSIIGNKEVVGVIDFSQHSSKERFYIIDMQSGRVETYQAAHGKNSDVDHDGYATQFSNTNGSNMSSQGIYLTAETYYGGHGYSLMLDGKSSTNSNARARAIVIHPADYVQPGIKIGRSWGCPALDPRFSEEVINQIKGGAVIYAA